MDIEDNKTLYLKEKQCKFDEYFQPPLHPETCHQAITLLECACPINDQ